MGWKSRAFITIKQTHSFKKKRPRRDEVRVYVIKTCAYKNTGDARQQQAVTAVSVSLLALGCRTHQAEGLIWAPSPLISKLSLWRESCEPALSEKAGLTWALGKTEHVCIHSHVYNVWEPIMDFSDEWEAQSRVLIGCLCVSGRSSVTQALSTKSSVSRKCARRAAILFSWQPVLSHTQISVEALIQTLTSWDSHLHTNKETAQWRFMVTCFRISTSCKSRFRSDCCVIIQHKISN